MTVSFMLYCAKWLKFKFESYCRAAVGQRVLFALTVCVLVPPSHVLAQTLASNHLNSSSVASVANNMAAHVTSHIAVGLYSKSLYLVSNSTATAWDLQANFEVNMPQNLVDLAKSVPLYFVFEWYMNRSRWYWRDEHLAKGKLYWRLSYNRLTQQWRMSTASTDAVGEGRFALTFSSLNEALASIRHIRRDGLVRSNQLHADQTYEIKARLHLDTTLLPKPFQTNAINDSDWALDSGMMQASILALAPVSSMVPVRAK
jgi:hypothetical protein